MNTKLFYTHYNAIYRPKNYKQYIGKKYAYGKNVITIVDVVRDEYFATMSTMNGLIIHHNILSFLNDIEIGLYKEIK